MKDIEKKRQKEQEVVELIIRLYCKKNHKEAYKVHNDLCPECRELAEYAKMRSAKCPFMETKTFCNNCKVHCYKPEMRQKIKTVMRFSGPRMIFYHPILAIWHLTLSIKEKKTLAKENPQ